MRIHEWVLALRNSKSMEDQDGSTVPEIVPTFAVDLYSLTVVYVGKDETFLVANKSDFRYVGDNIYWDGMDAEGRHYAKPRQLKIGKFECDKIWVTNGILSVLTTIDHVSFEPPKEQPKRDEKAIKAIKDSLDQRWSKIVKCKTAPEWKSIIDSTKCALCTVYSESGEPCPLKGEKCSGKYCTDEWANFFNNNYDYEGGDGGQSMYALLCRMYKEYSGLDYVPEPEPKPKTEHPEPKFAIRQMINNREIEQVLFSTTYNTWIYDIGGLWWKESDLAAVSKITVTLFIVKDGKVETETRSESEKSIDLRNDKNKDFYANLCFSEGYCAILIDDGKTKQRRFHPDLEKMHPYLVGWEPFEENQIEWRIKDDLENSKWIVKSHEVKMRAYSMNNGTVQVFSGAEPIFDTSIDGGYSVILTALGFTSENIMPPVLHGKG